MVRDQEVAGSNPVTPTSPKGDPQITQIAPIGSRRESVVSAESVDRNPGLPAVLLTEEQIATRVRELAEQISADYAGRELLVIGVLKGSWVFLADLVRLLTVPLAVDFTMVSSYGANTESSGEVKTVLDVKCRVEGRDVLVVEDIIDTGLTLNYIVDNLRLRQPRSLKIVALMDKPARRRVGISADYVGFEVPDRFVVGYGVDLAEQYRALPYVGYIEE
ncbi:hypoxanthine phosphoribosyltransferase [candidate division WOR-3 bacterium]|uniref:Hypoxanthine phosphoribosyltransferase n=1 Tax=candidate division WOR-3 bacterium TaxID=2052148 RepID=A0A937XHJ4_UNCW3|nr:hypoxanthine phosphoribosyltransferase [candidate division WOR-3 bacterium]